MIRIKKGLDLPVGGKPVAKVTDGPTVTRAALVASDYVGLKPTMLVNVGDRVKVGQPVFSCKKIPGVVYTSPAGGTVVEVNRGARRAFESLVVEIDGKEEFVEFEKTDESSLGTLKPEDVRKRVLDSGMWTAFRTRPYSKAPGIDTSPKSIFVTAMDSSPYAPQVETILGDGKDFHAGLQVLEHLAQDKVHVCMDAHSKFKLIQSAKTIRHTFTGPHPAGNAGTHISHIDPVHEGRVHWTIGFQDVMALGSLFINGRLSVERMIAIGGSELKEPRLIRTRLGAQVSPMIKGEVSSKDEMRVISGSILNGHIAAGSFDYLGRFFNQVSVLKEGRDRIMLGWLDPGPTKFSKSRAFIASAINLSVFKFNTNKNGSDRAMVPIELYEQVVAIDTLPTQLLRALVVKDIETAVSLGVLEFDEEDLALCTYVDPGKVDYGPYLREMLTTIELEG